MNESELYAGREQTRVKHYILERYLERFAHIVGSAWSAITYVDCFAGPWNARSVKFEDSSFSLALRQLRAARENLADLKRARGQQQLELRCYFLERDVAAFQKLWEFVSDVRDVEIKTRNAALEESIDDIREFLNKRRSFPFLFFDPTGWTGFPLDVIEPLLKLDPGEALFNFMTKDIVRFIELPDPSNRKGFDRMFGPIDYRARISALFGQDREDELVRCYCDSIRCAGAYRYVCPAIILHPEIDRTHFHLIYATRSPKGVEVFKETEKQAMKVMEAARSEAQKRKRVNRTGQLELLDAQEMHDTRHYDGLRERHMAAARTSVEQLLQTKRAVPYDEAWITALLHPLVWESDLKSWIDEWKRCGWLKIIGMKPGARKPKCNEGHSLNWQR